MLALVRVLLRLPGNAANDRLLRDYLEAMGLHATSAEIREHIQQLKELGLSNVEHNKDLVVVKLTEKGADVAEGRSQSDCVRRPGPECPY